MTKPSSLFASITDEPKEARSKLVSASQQYKHKILTRRNNTTEKCALFRDFTEILFDLFPSIFMPYLDIETFLSLLKTDLWNWYHLLSDSIVFDYCNYISIRHKEQIKEFCRDCDSDFYSSESKFLMNFYSSESELKDEEQNFAILRIACNQTIQINKLFISNVFNHIDIINDRMSLIEAIEIGLTTPLCKNITITNNKFKNIHNNNIIFVYDTFKELQNDLEIKQYYNKEDLIHIKTLLITDILNICVDIWYFVEWHAIKDEYIENNQRFQIIETKQMIVGHFNSAKYLKYIKYSNKKSDNTELFVAWSIEWQSTQQN